LLLATTRMPIFSDAARKIGKLSEGKETDTDLNRSPIILSTILIPVKNDSP